MAYALEKWEKFISTTIYPDKLSSYSTNGETIQLLLDQSENDRDKVRKQMINHAFSISKEKAMEMFVQHHQVVVIKLLDKIHSYKQVSGLDKDLMAMYEKMEEHLQYILDFIEHYFSKYFDLQEKVPASYLNFCKTDLCGQLIQCKDILRRQAKGDKKLTDLLCNHLTDFCYDGYMNYSYLDVVYHKELFSQIFFIDAHKTNHSYLALKDLLIYLNFNTLLFINYFISQLHDELNLLPGKTEKIERLASYKKHLGQMNIKPGFALHSEFPSVKQTLLDSIEKEIEYLTRIKEELLRPEDKTIVAAPEKSVQKEYIHVPFKVPEIYLFNKSFIDAGGAPSETYKSIFEKTGPYLSNKNQRGFSPESLQKASDKVDPEAKDTVKRFLQKMIRNIDSYE